MTRFLLSLSLAQLTLYPTSRLCWEPSSTSDLRHSTAQHTLSNRPLWFSQSYFPHENIPSSAKLHHPLRQPQPPAATSPSHLNSFFPPELHRLPLTVNLLPIYSSIFLFYRKIHNRKGLFPSPQYLFLFLQQGLSTSSKTIHSRGRKAETM